MCSRALLCLLFALIPAVVAATDRAVVSNEYACINGVVLEDVSDGMHTLIRWPLAPDGLVHVLQDGSVSLHVARVPWTETLETQMVVHVHDDDATVINITAVSRTGGSHTCLFRLRRPDERTLWGDHIYPTLTAVFQTASVTQLMMANILTTLVYVLTIVLYQTIAPFVL